MLDRIDLVITADDVVGGKPDPEGFLLACSRLGIFPPGAVAVEDSLAGIRAASAAGIGHVVGVTTSVSAAALVEAGAHTTYADLLPLANLFARR